MDQRLRELERRVAAGDAGAKTQLLVERVRRGEFKQRTLQLLAYLGDEAALGALDGKAPNVPESLESWVRGLAPWGRVVWVRAAVAAARLLLAAYEAQPYADERARGAIEAAEAWLANDTEETIEKAYAAADNANAILRDLESPDFLRNAIASARAFRDTRAAVQAALVVVEEKDRALTHAVQAAVAARERIALGETPAGTPERPSALYIRAARADRLGELPELATVSATATVRAAMAGALIAWVYEEQA